MRFTATTLSKLETILEEIGYSVRYEKGSFNSGYCLVENKKIAVVNRFFDTSARCNSLVEILSKIEFDAASLSEKSADFYQKLLKNQSEV